MNLQHQQFAAMEGLDGQGLNGLDGIGKKLKKLRRKVSSGIRKVSGADLAKKAIGRKNYGKIRKVGQKAEEFAKRNGVAIAGAVATVVTGGAAAPALMLAAKKTAAAEAVRKIAKDRAKRKQKKMLESANSEIERQAAEYEATMEAPVTNSAAGGGSYTGSSTTAMTADATDTAEPQKKTGWVLPAGIITAAMMALG